MKIIKFCHYCGKKYYVDKSQKDRSKFCSDFCFRKSKNTQVEYNCEFCGQPFKVIKSKYEKAINGDVHLYCSVQCAKDVQKPKWGDILKLFEEREYVLLSKEWEYTALTRARKYCVLCGQISAIRKATTISRVSKKQTFLKELLRKSIQQL